MGGNITYLPETGLMSAFFLYILEYQKSDKLMKNSLYYEKRFAAQSLKHTTIIEKALRSAGTSMH